MGIRVVPRAFSSSLVDELLYFMGRSWRMVIGWAGTARCAPTRWYFDCRGVSRYARSGLVSDQVGQ
jgi:hypothetical protein